MIDYNDKFCSFRADTISVTFSDGATYNSTTSDDVNITSMQGRPLGDELILTFNENGNANKYNDGNASTSIDQHDNDNDNEQPSRKVRLYIIKPEQDWRKVTNETILYY